MRIQSFLKHPRRISIVTLIAGLVLAFHSQRILAQDRFYLVQGVFCNEEAQLDSTLAHFRAGVAPRLAVELANDEEIVCTYIDLLQYMVVDPVQVGDGQDGDAFLKFKAVLVGVVVGDESRPVSPAVPLYFVAPRPIVGLATGQRA